MEFVKQQSTICMYCKDILVRKILGSIFRIPRKDAKGKRTGRKKFSFPAILGYIIKE